MTQQILERPVETPKSEAAPTTVYPPLNALDRCDGMTWATTKDGSKVRKACGAQAFIRAVFPDTGFDLLFCGHCLGEQTLGKSLGNAKAQRQSEDRTILTSLGVVLHSQYDTINLKPTDASQANGF